MRWLGPEPTLAVTMYGWAAFYMHLSVGTPAGGKRIGWRWKRAGGGGRRRRGRWGTYIDVRMGYWFDWRRIDRFRLQSTVRFRAPRLPRIGAKDTKKKETWSSTATLCVPQVNPKTLLPPTSVENVVCESRCVLTVLGIDCTMLKFQ